MIPEKIHSESEEKKADESQKGERTGEKNSDASRKPSKSDDDEKKKNDKSSGYEKKKSRRRSNKAFIIGGIVLVILIVLGVLYYLHSRHFVYTDDSYTAGHIHEISARIAGTAIQVPVAR